MHDQTKVYNLVKPMKTLQNQKLGVRFSFLLVVIAAIHMTAVNTLLLTANDIESHNNNWL
jgi:hypothetical protein